MRSNRTPEAFAEVIGLAWALVLALGTALLFVLSLCALPSPVALGGAIALALGSGAFGARILLSQRAGERSRAGTSAALMTTVGLGMALTQVLLAIWLALRAPLVAWDSWAIWAFKGHVLATKGVQLSFFLDPATTFAHHDYPLNVPLAESVIFRLAGASADWLVSLIGPCCLAALLLLFFAGLARLHGRSVAALSTGALALVPALSRQAASGYADVPVALYMGAATLYLVLWWRLQRPVDAILMGLLAGGAVWTKKEGVAVAGLLLLLYAVAEMSRGRGHARWHERVGRIGSVLLAMAASALPWLLFSHLAHLSGGDFLPVTPAVFLANVGRFPTILLYLAQQMTTLSNWSIFWIILVSMLLLTARRLSRWGYGLLFLLLGQLGVYMLSYVFSGWNPYINHILTSMDRLVLQAVPVALLLLVECVVALAGLGRRDSPVSLPRMGSVH